DDFASMRQAVERRYRRVLEETGAMPDLILIDGGRGQLNAALAALTELGVEETAVISLAKREEEVYLPEAPEPLRLARDDAGLRLLQEIRDEAHRFAVSRHRRKLLIQTFGSVQGVREASLDELQKALGPTMGRKVFEQMQPAQAVEPGG